MQPAYYPSGTFGALLPPQTRRRSATGSPTPASTGPGTRAAGRTPTATSARPGYTNGRRASEHADRLLDPNVDPNSRAGVPAAHWPRCPDNLFQYHHQPFNYFANFSTDTPAAGRTGRRTSRTRSEFQQLAASSGEDVQPQAGQLRQAVRHGERAPRLRQRAGRQRPPRRPAQVDRGQRVREGHDGRSWPTTSSAGSGITSRRRARATTTARTTSGARARASRRSSSRRT